MQQGRPPTGRGGGAGSRPAVAVVVGGGGGARQRLAGADVTPMPEAKAKRAHLAARNDAFERPRPSHDNPTPRTQQHLAALSEGLLSLAEEEDLALPRTWSTAPRPW